MAQLSVQEEQVATTFTASVISGKYTASYDLAYRTVLSLKDVIENKSWSSEQELLAIIRKIGHRMTQSLPGETVVRNMVQRVLKIVQDEHTGQPEADHQESLQKLMLANADQLRHQMSLKGFKNALIDAIGELLTELDTSAFNIATQAQKYIHSDEVIMTVGKSKTVQTFFKKAAKKVKFQVIVVERAPVYDGHEMASSLAKDGIKVTVITDSAVFAVMSRVNKVILATHTILANGGLKANCGSHAVALAAKYYSIPVIVCAALFKLSPHYFCSHDDADFIKLSSPQKILNFSPEKNLSNIQFENPHFDYVPPELVTSFISNIGGNAPSYVYRLLAEYYPAENYDLLK